LRQKKCGAGTGWDGLRGGCGLEVCRCWQNFSNSCRCGAGADTKFQPVQDSSVNMVTWSTADIPCRKPACGSMIVSTWA